MTTAGLEPTVRGMGRHSAGRPHPRQAVTLVLVAVAAVVVIALRRPDAAVGTAYLVAVAFTGVPLDFRYPAAQDFHWAAHVRAFDRAPRGEVVDIPIPPAGWQVRLTRR